MFKRRASAIDVRAMTEPVNAIATWCAMARPQGSRTRGTDSCELVPRDEFDPPSLASVAGTNRFLCGDLIPARRRVTLRSDGESSHANAANAKNINITSNLQKI